MTDKTWFSSSTLSTGDHGPIGSAILVRIGIVARGKQEAQVLPVGVSSKADRFDVVMVAVGWAERPVVFVKHDWRLLRFRIGILELTIGPDEVCKSASWERGFRHFLEFEQAHGFARWPRGLYPAARDHGCEGKSKHGHGLTLFREPDHAPARLTSNWSIKAVHDATVSGRSGLCGFTSTGFCSGSLVIAVVFPT